MIFKASLNLLFVLVFRFIKHSLQYWPTTWDNSYNITSMESHLSSILRLEYPERCGRGIYQVNRTKWRVYKLARCMNRTMLIFLRENQIHDDNNFYANIWKLTNLKRAYRRHIFFSKFFFLSLFFELKTIKWA